MRLEREGRRDEALAAIRQALKLAPADRVVLTKSAAALLKAGNDTEALGVLRQLADVYPTLSKAVWPVFAAAIDAPVHKQFFERATRDDPRWWPEFFDFACRQASAAALQSSLMARSAAGTATPSERRGAIDRLQREQQWAAAYQLWLNSLPAGERQRIGFIYNGGFESPLSNLGFDWVIQAQGGVVVATDWTAGANGRHALHLRFVNKRYTSWPIHEYLLLVPGRYRLEGRGRAERFDSWLGLQWGLYCQDAAGADVRQLARTEPLTGTSEWTAFRHEFVVGAGCPVQMLRLELANPKPGATTAGDAPVTLKGSLWFDDLRAVRID